ncbi:MAG TPA: GYD domain-containing protein [Acidimicrobiia bacterium]|nr:GYD domain-containing protein [Acidimicrobiia bacterium]
MPKYLVIASYTAEGAKGVLAKGGSARRDAVDKMVSDLGGTVESFYFAFGADDVFVTIDLPDNVAAAALGLAVGASGATALRTTVLLTPEEIDRASQVTVAYETPGS